MDEHEPTQPRPRTGFNPFTVGEDVHIERGGGAFLFVYAPTDDDCRRAMATLGQLNPVFARRYLPMAIERLIYPARVQPDV